MKTASTEEKRMGKMNLRQKLFVVFLDVLVFSELAFSIYCAHLYGDAMTSVFLKIYLPMVLTTLVIGKICLNRLKSDEDLLADPEKGESLVPIKITKT